jgi:hypothetical protein
MTLDSVTAPSAPVTYASSVSAEDPGDSAYGWVMFWIFIAAVLAITFAVCVLALAQSWWMLGVVYGTDLFVTGLVFKVVLGALDVPATPELDSTDATSHAALPGPVIGLTEHRATVAAHH